MILELASATLFITGVEKNLEGPISRLIYVAPGASKENRLANEAQYLCQKNGVQVEVCMENSFTEPERRFLDKAIRDLFEALFLNQEVRKCLVEVDQRYTRVATLLNWVNELEKTLVDRNAVDDPRPPRLNSLALTPFRKVDGKTPISFQHDSIFAYPDFYRETSGTYFPYYSVGINQEILNLNDTAVGWNYQYWSSAIFIGLLINKGVQENTGNENSLLLNDAAQCVLFQGSRPLEYQAISLRQFVQEKSGVKK